MSSPLGTKVSHITDNGACGWSFNNFGLAGKKIWIAEGVLCPLCEEHEFGWLDIDADWNEDFVFVPEDAITCEHCEQSFGVSIDRNGKVEVEAYRPRK